MSRAQTPNPETLKAQAASTFKTFVEAIKAKPTDPISERSLAEVISGINDSRLLEKLGFFGIKKDSTSLFFTGVLGGEEGFFFGSEKTTKLKKSLAQDLKDISFIFSQKDPAKTKPRKKSDKDDFTPINDEHVLLLWDFCSEGFKSEEKENLEIILDLLATLEAKAILTRNNDLYLAAHNLRSNIEDLEKALAHDGEVPNSPNPSELSSVADIQSSNSNVAKDKVVENERSELNLEECKKNYAAAQKQFSDLGEERVKQHIADKFKSPTEKEIEKLESALEKIRDPKKKAFDFDKHRESFMINEDTISSMTEDEPSVKEAQRKFYEQLVGVYGRAYDLISKTMQKVLAQESYSKEDALRIARGLKIMRDILIPNKANGDKDLEIVFKNLERATTFLFVATTKSFTKIEAQEPETEIGLDVDIKAHDASKKALAVKVFTKEEMEAFILEKQGVSPEIQYPTNLIIIHNLDKKTPTSLANLLEKFEELYFLTNVTISRIVKKEWCLKEELVAVDKWLGELKSIVMPDGGKSTNAALDKCFAEYFASTEDLLESIKEEHLVKDENEEKYIKSKLRFSAQISDDRIYKSLQEIYGKKSPADIQNIGNNVKEAFGTLSGLIRKISKAKTETDLTKTTEASKNFDKGLEALENALFNDPNALRSNALFDAFRSFKKDAVKFVKSSLDLGNGKAPATATESFTTTTVTKAAILTH